MKKRKTLKDLASITIQQKKPAPPQEPKKSATEEDLFSQAMDGVQPLQGSGRQVAGSPRSKQDKPKPPEKPGKQPFSKLVEESLQFSIEHSEEYLQAHIKGLNNKTFQKLKSGQLSPQAHIDLHGMNSDQAYGALMDFIQEHYMLDKRCVLVITGRGMNSPLGLSILKQEIQVWLTQDPFRRVVLAFCSALPKDGGTGALYVLLRKYRKQQGKIIWNRFK